VSRNPVKSAALDWPEGELPSGEDSLWARFDYLKLRETLEAIVSAMEATTKAELPSSEPEAGLMLRLVVSNDEPEKGEGSPRDGAAENKRESLD
jgi:hypothetical protein